MTKNDPAIYRHYATARDRIHGFDIVKVDPDYGYMIECERCGVQLDYAEQAEGCRDPLCPMLERETKR